ncbi:MAG: glycosyltransferase family 2 protein [Paracoccus sp. (in: a-proteobacteria)]
MTLAQTRFDLIDTPIPPTIINLLCDEPAAPEMSRKQPWLAGRLGFIGSSATLDLLRFDATVLALTPQTAGPVIEAGLIDALVIEGAADDLTGKWGHDFMDYAAASPPARKVMALAGRLKLPRIALLIGSAGRAPLFAPLARAADHVIVTAAGAYGNLARRNIAAELVPQPVQTARYHGFQPMAGLAGMPETILSLDLDRALNEAELRQFLTTLRPFGLRLASSGVLCRAHRRAELGELGDCTLGAATDAQLQTLLHRHDVLIQAAGGNNPARDQTMALRAAAARCAVLVLGELAAGDPRRAFARSFTDPAGLRLHLSRMTMDPVWTERELQTAWRQVHLHHGPEHLVSAITRTAGLPADPPRLMASVVAPSLRPERLQGLIETFRAQLWPAKELIVVANTDHPEEWNTRLLDPARGESILFLSREFEAGMAINLGAGRAKGDYVLRMDDDDAYGPAYIQDMMLAAGAMGADIMGKPPCFYIFPDAPRFCWQPRQKRRPSSYFSRDFRRGEAGHLAGYSHCFRRAIAATVPFPTDSHGGADSGFLRRTEEAGDLLCLRLDVMNAVIERRGDASSHTWRGALGSGDPRLADMPVSLDAFLDPGAAATDQP